jgi:hypothetical protein
MNKNYQLLIIDRYNIGQSDHYILPSSFMKRFVKKELKKAVKVDGGYMGCDSEEVSYLWQTTDKKVNSKSKLYMDDMYDLWEEESW